MADDSSKLPEEAPKVPLIPASMHIHTKKPEWGWWKWTIIFDEETYSGHAVIPWQPCGRERRHFETKLSCSETFDPVPELHWFLRCIIGDNPCNEWQVDEEGHLLTLQVWNLDAVKVQLRIFSQFRDDDFSWDFILDRDAFMEELDAAYCSFGGFGGWGTHYGDNAIENGYREEVRIDTGYGVIADSGRASILF